MGIKINNKQEKNKETKKMFLGVLASIMIILAFTACNNNEKNNENLGNNISSESGTQENIVDNNTYNNGGLFVQYKGKTYYREYSNGDIEEGALGADYNYVMNVRTSKYINDISTKDRIENVFEDSGYGEFYILDDRFFFEGYNKIYSVNMKGEEYRDFGKGIFIGCDEENHKIYYKNTNNNNLYVIETQTLRITKLGEYDVFLIEDNMIYFKDSATAKNGQIKISVLDLQKNETKEICAINVDTESQEEYYISDAKKYEENLFVLFGYNSGTINSFSGSKLYAINLKDNSYKVLDENVGRELKLHDNLLYYTFLVDEEQSKNVLKKVDVNSMKISTVDTNVDSILIKNNIILENASNLTYFDENINKKEIISIADLETFKEKYNISNDDDDYFVQVTNVELVGKKIYYTVELSKENEEYTIGWRTGYERVATEVYMHDLTTGKNTKISMV